MALSFGRKKGEATNEANNSPSGANSGAQTPMSPNAASSKTSSVDEALDESWFDTLAEEAAANPLPTTSADPAPAFSVPASNPAPDFSVFSTEEPDDFGDLGTKVDIPSQPATATGGAFVDLPTNSSPSAGAATPFDLPPVVSHAADQPAKKSGGLKKLLPVLLVLLIVGGGGAFWYSQQPTGEEEGSEIPPVTGTINTQPTGAPATSAPPVGTAPSGAASTGGAPATAKADPKVKAQLKQLWNEGLMLRKQNKMAAAKAKWGAAVRLARSKPGHEKSAEMIQQALDKLK